jgi:hypothetical protein
VTLRLQNTTPQPLSDSIIASVVREIGSNPFEDDIDFAEDSDGFAVAATTSAPLDPANDDQSPRPYIHSDEWHLSHGYTRFEGQWVDRIWLNVRLAQQEAVEAEHRWREESGLPAHIGKARVPMRARRMKQDAPPLPFEER